MSPGITQLKELIQSAYKKFGYTADDEVITATLNQTMDVLKNNDPPAEDIIEEICLAKSCSAKSKAAYDYFTNKYLAIIKKSLRYRILELKLLVELESRLDDVANYVLQCLLYGKDADEKCPPSYTLERFDRRRASLNTFISNIIKPRKAKGIIANYMYRERIWLPKKEPEPIPYEEYMERQETLPSQTIEILSMSSNKMKKEVEKLFELCKSRPEDTEIIEALATMYGVRKRIYPDETFKTNYVVDFIETNGNKGMFVKNAKDNKFFSHEEVKFHLNFILGFQLHLEGGSWMLLEEISDRMFEGKDALNPISRIIAEIRDDLSNEGFNKNLIEDNGLKTEYRLSTNPDLVHFEAGNRYLRLWFFELGYKGITKENIRKKKKDAFDRLRKIGGDDFYDVLGEN